MAKVITVIPLNLIFYIAIVAIGFLLITESRYLGKIIATFVYAFLAVWVSEDVLLDVGVWYIDNYNSTSGNYTYAYATQDIATPYNIVFIWLNIALAFFALLSLYFTIDRDYKRHADRA